MLKEFTTEIISVSVGGAVVTVSGQKLKIARFDENEIEITGRIESVETSSTTKRKV